MKIETGKENEWDKPDDEVYVLRLFVTGASAVSVRAINNLQEILEKELRDSQ